MAICVQDLSLAVCCSALPTVRGGSEWGSENRDFQGGAPASSRAGMLWTHSMTPAAHTKGNSCAGTGMREAIREHNPGEAA